MSYLTKNIIPGDFGKVFVTDAKKEKDLDKISGIQDVIVDKSIFPVEIIIHSRSVVSVETVENEVIRFGFHAIPKGVFEV